MLESYLPILVAGLGLAALTVIALVNQRRLENRIDSLFDGLDSDGNIEETLRRYFTETKAVRHQITTLQQNYQHISKIAAMSLQKTAIVRFNPFKHTGGDQSFALALLDNHDSGFILTSIHSREGTRVYIKPITYGASDHTLSKEERSALEIARNNNGSKE